MFTKTRFDSLQLPDSIMQGITSLGWECLTEVQRDTIPLARQGRDVIGQARTGSGKTAAFGIPILERCQPTGSLQGLVLAPTRELAQQVAEEMILLQGDQGLSIMTVYGGTDLEKQARGLESGVDVIVGTPGRVMDMSERGHLDLSKIEIFCLDEADRMLDMGFREDMEIILGDMPENRQTLFFSATMNCGVEGLIRNFSKNPQEISIERKALTVDTIEQTYYEVRNRSKIEVLCRLLDLEINPRGIVFCNTKQMVEDATEALTARGYVADRIHGDITQANRERVIKRFKDGAVELLVATDVAARGLDIDDVDIVFNYNLPYDPEDYVHRIGRTGRAGRSGKSVTFVYGRDIYRLEAIERYTRQVVKRMQIPSLEDVEGRKADKVFNQVRSSLEKGAFKRHDDLVDRLLDAGHTPTDIASALFDLLGSDEGREGEIIAEDNEAFHANPKRKSGKKSGGCKWGHKKKHGGGSYQKRGNESGGGKWNEGGKHKRLFETKSEIAGAKFKKTAGGDKKYARPFKRPG